MTAGVECLVPGTQNVVALIIHQNRIEDIPTLFTAGITQPQGGTEGRVTTPFYRWLSEDL